MAAFNLTAQLNLQGPTNLRPVIATIRRELSSLSLDLNINPRTSQAIRGVTSDVNLLSAALRNAQGNASSLNVQLRTLVSTLANVNTSSTAAATSLGNLNRQVNSNRNNTRQAGSDMEEFGRQSALAVRRFAAFTVATGSVYALVRALSSAYTEFVQFNKEFVRLQQVTGSTATSLSALSSEITRLSTGLGVSSAELLNVSTTLAQAGLTATQTKTALQALARSSLAPSFDSMNATVEGSIALMQQFGISTNDLESALGSINSVAAKFAVEASDIITAIQRTGGVFASASKGISTGTQALNEFIAIFTSVRATTRESAETIATGLRTIFTRIQRGSTIEALKEFGVNLTDLEGKFVGPYEAVRRLSAGLSGLDTRDLRFSKIVEELGGFRQINKVIPLLQQFALAQQALGVAQRGSGSLAADAAKGQEALAVRITKVREEFISLIRDIGQTQSFQRFADISLTLASALISVASAAKEVLPAIAAIAAIRAVPAIGQYFRGVSGGLGGGRGRGFAKGGIVPGSGSGDTVPARLTPGEFVIRKSAVNAIGAGNLQRMNRYNDGGKIRDLIKTKKQLANVYDVGPETDDTYAPPIIMKDRIKKSRTKYREEANKIWNAASTLYQTSGIDAANKHIKKSTDGLSAKLKHTELVGDGPGRLNKIQGALAEKTVAKSLKSSGRKYSRLPYMGGADFMANDGSFIEVKNKEKTTNNNELIAKALLGYAFTRGSGKNKFKDGQHTFVPPVTIGLKSTNPKDMKMASGGSVKDTVPALLTPGEFVVNKQAASRIGGATLNRMNRADKVQGFNKGGFVGIQKFADGGDVEENNNLVMGFNPMTIITALGAAVVGFRLLANVIPPLARTLPTLTRSMGLFNRSVDMGLPRAGRGTARPGQPNAGARDFTGQGSAIRRNGSFDGMALAFGGTAVAQSLGDNVGGTTGKQISETGTAVAGVLGLAAAMGALTNPLGLLATVIVAGVTAFSAWYRAARDATIQQNEKNIEQKSKNLDKAFDKLADTTDKSKIKESQRSILSDVKKVAISEGNIRREKTAEAEPGFLSKLFLGSKTDTVKLSQELNSSSKLSGETLAKYIIDALRKGQSIPEVMQQVGASGIKMEDLKQSIAITSGGTAVTDIMAKIAAAKQEDPAADTTALDKELKTLKDKLFQEFLEGAKALTKIPTVGLAAAAVLDTFTGKLKNVGAAAQRASVEFENSKREAKISSGFSPGEKVEVAEPALLNEDMFSNLAAYSSKEIVVAINNLGKILRLPEDITKGLTNTALSKQALESELPKILAEASLKQKKGEFKDTDQAAISDKLLKVFKSIPEIGNTEASAVVDDIMETIGQMTGAGKSVTLDSLASESKLFAMVLKSYTENLTVGTDLQKEFNGILKQGADNLNKFIDSVSTASDLRNQAAVVKNEGSVALSRAMGEPVSLRQMNSSFNDTLTSLTTRIGPKGAIAGTGTNDPNVIATRIAQKSKEQADIQKKLDQTPQGTPEYDALKSALARVTLETRNLGKAQEKLATDSSRASNALSKIQDIRRTQEAGRGLFDNVLKNLNNPEWIMEFQNSVQSLIKVRSGKGTIDDIAPALEAFNQRASTLPEGQAEQERKALDANLRRILINNGADAGTVDLILQKIGSIGPNQELQDTIKIYTDAVNAQADALNNQAVQTADAGKSFFESVQKAGDTWVDSVARSAGGVVPGAPGGRPGPRPAGGLQRGGMVYASEGQYINFQPKGTDTVPAMLTPGEFVVNRNATQKNIGLLRNINNGGKAYSSGGVVYARTGGEILDDIDSLSSEIGDTEALDNSKKQSVLNKSSFKALKNAVDLYQQSMKIDRRSATVAVGDLTLNFQRDMDRFRKRSKKVAGIIDDGDPLDITKYTNDGYVEAKTIFMDGYKDLKSSDIRKYIDDPKNYPDQPPVAPKPGQPNQPPVAPQPGQPNQPPVAPQFPGFGLDQMHEFDSPNGGIGGNARDPVVNKIEEQREKALARTENPKYVGASKDQINSFYNEKIRRRDNFLRNAPGATKRRIYNESVEQQEKKEFRLQQAQENPTFAQANKYDPNDSPEEKARKKQNRMNRNAEIKYGAKKGTAESGSSDHTLINYKIEEFDLQFAKFNPDVVSKARALKLDMGNSQLGGRSSDVLEIGSGFNPEDTEHIFEAAGYGVLPVSMPELGYTNDEFNKLSDSEKETYNEEIIDNFRYYTRGLAAKVKEKNDGERRKEQTTRESVREAENAKTQALVDKGMRERQAQQTAEAAKASPVVPEVAADTPIGFGTNIPSDLQESMRPDRVPTNEEIRREKRSSYVEKFLAQKSELQRKFDMAASRAQAEIEENSRIRESAGFNSVVSAVTGSDPYGMAIENSRKKLGVVGYHKNELGKRWINRIDLSRDKRSYATESEENENIAENENLYNEYSALLASMITGEKSNANFFNNQVLPEHQNAISTTRDVAAQAVVGVGTLGVGAGASLGYRGAAIAGARMGAATSAATAVVAGVDDVASGRKTVAEAVADGATQTATGAATGATFGVAGKAVGNLAGKVSAGYDDITITQPLKEAQKRAAELAAKAAKAKAAAAAQKEAQKAAQKATERQSRKAASQVVEDKFNQTAQEISDMTPETFTAAAQTRAVQTKAANKAAAKATAEKATASGKSGGTTTTKVGDLMEETVPVPGSPLGRFGKPLMDYDKIPTGKTGGTTSTRVEDVVSLPANAGGGRTTIAYKRSTTAQAPAQKPAEPSFTTKPQSFRLFNKQTIPQSEMDSLVARYYADKGSLSNKELSLVKEFLSDPYNSTGSMFRLNRPSAPMSRGGVVYASKGQLIPYMPKGTDTVPAMLTPGEFVINRSATQKHLPLLKAINNNSNNVQGFSGGGRVQYFGEGADGAIKASSGGGGVSSISLDVTGLSSAFDNFSRYVEGLKSVIDSFGSIGSSLTGLSSIESAASKLSVSAVSLNSASSRLNDAMVTLGFSIGTLTQSLSNIPKTINFNATGEIPINISLDVNGGQGLDDKLSNFENDIYTKIENELRKSLPGININITRMS